MIACMVPLLATLAAGPTAPSRGVPVVSPPTAAQVEAAAGAAAAFQKTAAAGAFGAVGDLVPAALPHYTPVPNLLPDSGHVPLAGVSFSTASFSTRAPADTGKACAPAYHRMTAGGFGPARELVPAGPPGGVPTPAPAGLGGRMPAVKPWAVEPRPAVAPVRITAPVPAAGVQPGRLPVGTWTRTAGRVTATARVTDSTIRFEVKTKESYDFTLTADYAVAPDGTAVFGCVTGVDVDAAADADKASELVALLEDQPFCCHFRVVGGELVVRKVRLGGAGKELAPFLALASGTYKPAPAE